MVSVNKCLVTSDTTFWLLHHVCFEIYTGPDRPVIIAFGVPLIATETFLCLSESFLCHL